VTEPDVPGGRTSSAGPGPIGNICLPISIEEDDGGFCAAATAAKCGSNNEGSEDICVTITILVITLEPGEGCCQRGPAGKGQKNVGGDDNTHYRCLDKKSGSYP